ncbi:hypothetical protein [Hoeflea sp.]|uniref:hypothetical protein n=1 Tax=Hoeflea sp. TaxID=1940281 RepID=UPI003B02685B
MRVVAILALMLATSPASAEAQRLTGDEISELLPGIIASTNATNQTFERNGDTGFTQDGRTRSGRWRVRDDFYCSLWPPSDAWRCYEVHLEASGSDAPDRIIWVDPENREETVNFILPKTQ